jgi:Bacterial capsule synthesis protein PGA_cap
MKIALCGDIMPGAEVGERIGAGSLAEWFSDVRSAWLDADAVIGNLESPCVVSADAIPKSRPELVFRSPAHRVRELAEAGFSVLTLANNHVLDCGTQGLVETIRALDEAGIHHTGAGMNLSEALEPALLRIDDRTLGIVAFGYAPAAAAKQPGAAPCDRKTMARGLAQARSRCDVLVAVLHDGLEYTDVPPKKTRARFRFLAENGADIVVGHHPHVLQGLEWVGRVPVAYSLGDLLFQNSLPHVAKRNFERMALAIRHPEEVRRDPEKFSRGAVLTIEASGGTLSPEWHPFRQASLRPRLSSDETLREDTRRLEALSAVLLDTHDSRHRLADQVMEECYKESLAAVQWPELLRLARRPKWRYVPRGMSWLAGRLKKAVWGT